MTPLCSRFLSKSESTTYVTQGSSYMWGTSIRRGSCLVQAGYWQRTRRYYYSKACISASIARARRVQGRYPMQLLCLDVIALRFRAAYSPAPVALAHHEKLNAGSRRLQDLSSTGQRSGIAADNARQHVDALLQLHTFSRTPCAAIGQHARTCDG